MCPIPPLHHKMASSVTMTPVVLRQLTITHQCPYVGRYVTVYNYRHDPKRYSWYSNDATLDLCEVQVWGCSVGTYGDGNCDNTCSVDCFGGKCNATTGTCFYCFTGSFGNFCNKICPLYCKDYKCEKDSGNCYECTDMWYGLKCELDCPENCKGNCDQDTGNCRDCVPQKHGIQCELNCSVQCQDILCEKETGNLSW